jgi:hypothetical protein
MDAIHLAKSSLDFYARLNNRANALWMLTLTQSPSITFQECWAKTPEFCLSRSILPIQDWKRCLGVSWSGSTFPQLLSTMHSWDFLTILQLGSFEWLYRTTKNSKTAIWSRWLLLIRST